MKIKTLSDAVNDVNPLPQCTCLKCTCNLEQKMHQMQKNHRMIQFMMKLNEDYSKVMGNILMQYPMPSITNAYRLFAQEERHKKISQLSSHTESMAFYSNRTRFNDPNKNFKASASKSQYTNASNSGANDFKTAGGLIKKTWFSILLYSLQDCST